MLMKLGERGKERVLMIYRSYRINLKIFEKIYLLLENLKVFISDTVKRVCPIKIN